MPYPALAVGNLRDSPWVRFAANQRVKVGVPSPDDVVQLPQADVQSAALNPGDPTAPFYSSCSHLRPVDQDIGGPGNASWQGEFEAGSFVHPEPGEAPQTAMAVFSLHDSVGTGGSRPEERGPRVIHTPAPSRQLTELNWAS